MIKHKACNKSLDFSVKWLSKAIGMFAIFFCATFLVQPSRAGEFGMSSKLAEQNMAEQGSAEQGQIEQSPLEQTSTSQNPATNLESEKKPSSKSLGLLADIRIHSAEELLEVLMQVDNLFAQGEIQAGVDQPIVFLLHGNEAKTLFKSAYSQHKKVVDLAARLSAFAVVDIKVCETWMGGSGLDKNNLQPFVGTVPYAVAEERRLLKEQGYTYF